MKMLDKIPATTIAKFDIISGMILLLLNNLTWSGNLLLNLFPLVIIAFCSLELSIIYFSQFLRVRKIKKQDEHLED